MNHEVVHFRRRTQLTVEKCKIHPSRYVNIYCKEYQIFLCIECLTAKKKSTCLTTVKSYYLKNVCLFMKKLLEFEVTLSQLHNM